MTMTAPNSRPNNQIPKTDLVKASSEKVPLDGCVITCLVIIYTTGVVFVVAATGFFWAFLPPWAAVLLGLLGISDLPVAVLNLPPFQQFVEKPNGIGSGMFLPPLPEKRECISARIVAKRGAFVRANPVEVVLEEIGAEGVVLR
jgi:hypothetical protein